MPRLVTVSATAPAAAALAEAAALLRAGELVAFPTETVYGLGANALDAGAVAKIFEAKGRPANNPLIVHVASPAMAREVVAEWPEAAEKLARAFWPGPLTLVLPKRAVVPDAVSAGLESVGVRMPAHPVALGLIREAGVPIAAPSANRYMSVSPTTAAHVARGLGDRVPLVLDGGATQVGLESTVLDLTREVPTVLRPGGLAIGRLREVLGTVEVLAGQHEDHVALPSPGLARRHYAPRAEVLLVPNAMALMEQAESRLALGESVGALGLGAHADAPDDLIYEAMPREPEAYGARLYAMLHAFDDRGVDTLIIEEPPREEAWAAVRDRLKRAATTL